VVQRPEVLHIAVQAICLLDGGPREERQHGTAVPVRLREDGIAVAQLKCCAVVETAHTTEGSKVVVERPVLLHEHDHVLDRLHPSRRDGHRQGLLQRRWECRGEGRASQRSGTGGQERAAGQLGHLLSSGALRRVGLEPRSHRTERPPHTQFRLFSLHFFRQSTVDYRSPMLREV
jgi:hypothetical protein